MIQTLHIFFNLGLVKVYNLRKRINKNEKGKERDAVCDIYVYLKTVIVLIIFLLQTYLLYVGALQIILRGTQQEENGVDPQHRIKNRSTIQLKYL